MEKTNEMKRTCERQPTHPMILRRPRVIPADTIIGKMLVKSTIRQPQSPPKSWTEPPIEISDDEDEEILGSDALRLSESE